MNKSNNNVNSAVKGVWVISAINSYSYDTTETWKKIVTSKEDAIRIFDERVKSYIDSEKDSLSERYGVSTNETLAAFLEIGAENEDSLMYGIEVLDNYRTLTIYSKPQNNDGTYDIGEYTITMEAIILSLAYPNHNPLLDNVKDVDTYIANIDFSKDINSEKQSEQLSSGLVYHVHSTKEPTLTKYIEILKDFNLSRETKKDTYGDTYYTYKIEINSLDDLEKLRKLVGRIIIKDSYHDYSMNLIKEPCIEIYDGYRE